MLILILFFLLLLYIGFPMIGEPLLFALSAILRLYVELFWFLLRLPFLLVRCATHLGQRHT
jgi:hypothetical protein